MSWLFNPREHATGNLMLGLGLKLPTGSYSDSVDVLYPDRRGPAPSRPIHTNGRRWSGYRSRSWRHSTTVGGGALVYLSGFYLFNPRVQTEITIGNRIGLPGNSAAGSVPYHLSVPDAYTLRSGVSFAVLPTQGLSLSVGGRVDGVPVQDLVNGGDDNFRRPGFGAFVDLGVDLSRGSNTFTLNVPVRAHADRRANLYDRQVDIAGGGNLARFQILASYTHRF